MNDLKVFENNDFGSVRIILRNNEPWFFAKDVCEILEIANVSDAIDRLDEDEKSNIVKSDVGSNTGIYDFSNGGRAPIIVSESGLYALIMRSNKPNAKAFRKWVTNVVLPSIRKTGSYGGIAVPDFTNPAEAARAWALEYEKRQLAIVQRDEAIRTKCHFIEGRDAEMCGRVGGLTTENNRLKDAVGKGRNWQTVSMAKQEWIKRFGHKPDYRKLQEFSKEVGIEPIKDVDETIRHDNGVLKQVKVYRYHKDAWKRYERYETLLAGVEA